MVLQQTPICPPTRVFEAFQIHRSECRSFAYSQDTRSMAIENRLTGFDGPENEQIVHLRNLGLYPSVQTVDRWVQRHIQHGHIQAFRRTGNHRSQREIKGRNLILLAFHRAILPKATIAEVNTFIFNMNQHDPNNQLHSYSQICRAESSLLITRKKGSTTAYQAMSPINLQRRHNFWHMPYPFGIVDIDPRDMIDLDEAGIYPQQTNRKYGKIAVGDRVREAGTYVRVRKLNVLMAISGDDDEVNGGERWYEMWEEGGTTIERFVAFLRRVIDEIGPGTNERRRVFTMDNLAAHRNPAVHAMIVAAGHRLVFRAPYYPVDGPIEYVFNSIQNILCVLHMREIRDIEGLRIRIEEVIGSIDNFSNYFAHVGFQY